MSSSLDFLIDIKQRSSGNAVTELDRLGAELDQAVAKYKQFETASVNAQRRLEQATAKRSAAEAGLQAIADKGDIGKYRKAVADIARLNAEEERLKSNATSAAAALEKQAAAATALANKVGALNKSASAKSAKTIFGEPLDIQKAAAATTKATTEVAKSAQVAKEHIEPLGTQAKKLGGAFTGLPGPLGRISGGASNTVGRFEDLKSVLGTTGAAAATATIAVVALAAALIIGAVAATHYALMTASASRNLALTAAAVVDGNKQVGASFQSITNDTGIASDRLLDITRSLKKADVAAANMPEALRAIAEQEQALGDSSGTQELIDKLKSGQLTVDQLAKDMDSKFGAITEKKMLGLDQQVDRLKAGFASMFATLHIESFLKAFKTVVDLFDSSTAAGKQMQATFATIFQPLVDGATSAMPSVRRMILFAELGVVEFLVALDPVAVSIRNAFQSEAVAEFTSFLTASAGDATALSLIFGLLKFQIDGIVGALGLATSAMKEFTSSKAQPGSDKFGNLTASASGLPGAFQGIGANVSAGLAAGIDSGAGAVDGSVQAIVQRAIAAGKSGFDQHSPSKEFEHIGDMNVAGLVGAHERGANDVEQSVDRLTTVPSLKPAGRRGGGGGLRIEKIEININGVADADDIADKAREAVLDALEQASLELGAGFDDEDEEEAA